jgi:PIN domain nuclease of toxin-antitoxin system
VRLLLDTHALLWFALGDSQLSPNALALITDPSHEQLVSAGTVWEIAIKVSIGKLILHQPYEDFIDSAVRQNGFSILPVEPRYTAALIGMPFHHRDPFDRLLIARSLVESIPVVSADAAFDAYGVQRLW